MSKSRQKGESQPCSVRGRRQRVKENSKCKGPEKGPDLAGRETTGRKAWLKQ